MKISTMSTAQYKPSLMSKFRNRFFAFGFLFSLFLLPLAGCGSASPAPGLPAPVSQLITIDNQGGDVVAVTGAPGAVPGGVTVNGFNSTKLAFTYNPLPWLLSVAHAQSGLPIELSVQANSDGSFAFNIAGSTNEILQITYTTLEGEESEPASFQIPRPDAGANLQEDLTEPLTPSLD